MKIIITNDDGIYSKGIIALAKMAIELGEVYVIAPEGECSAMSQHITVRERLLVREHDFPLPVKAAYCVSGTPADCIKVALAQLMTEPPDYVFSGINDGLNAGFDILYSGTVGAAMEALVNGVKAIAFSNRSNGSYDSIDGHLLSITREIIEKGAAPNEIWNVNFPGVSRGELKGILWDRKIAPFQYFKNVYEVTTSPEGRYMLAGGEPFVKELPLSDTDMSAVVNGYVSVGRVRSHVM